MIKNSVFILLTFIGLQSLAQKPASPKLYAETITKKDLKKHLDIIASAEMEGRDTPSPGLEKAADYIENQFKLLGLKPGNGESFRQIFELEKSGTPETSLKIGENQFEYDKDFKEWMQMPKKADLNFSEYIFIGFGIVDETRDDYKNIDVKGKLVILLHGSPKNFKANGRESTQNKIANAKKKGAAAVLIVTDNFPRVRGMNNSYRPKPKAASKEEGDAILAFYINSNVVSKSGNSIEQITELANSETFAPVVNNVATTLKYNSGNNIATASNVIGIVEGSDKKDEYLFLTAHYDHIGVEPDGRINYGADDDGSGTVAIIEMAEAFAKAKKAGKGPRRTVVFMTVAGEEKGLWGSEYYSENPIFPLDKTTADLNIDMIGRVDTERTSADTLNYVYVVGHNKLSTELPIINEGENNKYTKLVLDYKFDDPNDPNRIYYRSDHYNFARKGVPVLFFYDGMLKGDYHKPTDTIDKINFDLLNKRAKMIFYTAWEMANRKEMLKRDLESVE